MFRRRPRSTLDAEQRAFVLAMQGQISGREMADELGVSWSSVMRFARDRGLSLATTKGSRKYIIRPELLKRVCNFYETHGRAETEKNFPDVNVRSIVERYKLYRPRQVRWTENQLIEVSKMGGIIPFKDQAKFFRRPNAFAGSIKSVWIKRFGFSGGAIHGLSAYMAKELVKPDCPHVKTRFWNQRQYSKQFGRKLYLWVDIEKHLKGDVPKFIREGIGAMADFQRWLFQSKDPKKEIVRMIKDRS